MAESSPPPSPFTTSSGVALPVTQEQQQLWALLEQRGFFNIEPYIYKPMSDRRFEDSWISKLGLDPFLHVPSIPEAYTKEWLDERVVYLWGVPNNLTKEKMREHLEVYGTIERLPQLIDTTSRETFRWVILSSREEAARVVTCFPLVKLKTDHGPLVAMPACAPGRGLIRDFHAGKFDHGAKSIPLFKYTGELVPGRSLDELGEEAEARDVKLPNSFEDQIGQISGARAVKPAQHPRVPPPGLAQIAQLPNFPRYQPGIPPPPGLASYQAQAPYNSAQYFAYGDTSSVFDTPTPLGTSSQTSVLDTPTRVKEKADCKGKGKVENETETDSESDSESETDGDTETTNNAFFNQFGQASSIMAAGSHQYPYPYPFPYQTSDPYPNTNTYGAPYWHVPPNPTDPLIALLRKRDASASTTDETTPATSAPATSAPASVPQKVVRLSKAIKSTVAVPNITPIKQAQRERTTSVSSSTTYPKTTQKEPILVIKESLPTILERPKTPEQQPQVAEASSPPVAPYSWAAVAGNRSPGSKIIDVTPASVKPSVASRFKTVRIPSGPNPSKTEPLIDQMRVVFLLDIPGTITLEDISKAIVEGPVRSIHFGNNEETKSRYCAVVFQQAIDASKFTNVLLKERADCKPNRFRFIVDVVRGDEPFPLDDILRAMQHPLSATRRLTLVKASFFFIVGERILRAKVEKMVGEGAIELIWLYNGGNATIVFSDVGSAMTVKSEFDMWARNAGQPNGADKAWRGLLTSYSKDPCVQPLELKTALRD